MTNLWSVLLAYLLGSIPAGFLFVRWRSGVDLRAAGSGNPGPANAVREAGWLLGTAVLAIDLAKGAAAVWIASRLTSHSEIWMSVSAVAVMLGYIWPIFHELRGGKAVATFIGAFLIAEPPAAAAVLVVFMAMVAMTRYVSIGSVVAAVSFPLAAWLIAQAGYVAMLASLLAAALIVVRHVGNLRRLRAGTEPRLPFARKRR